MAEEKKATIEELFEEMYEEHSEILTLLDINNVSDINILIQLLEINMKKVKKLEYDSDKA